MRNTFKGAVTTERGEECDRTATASSREKRPKLVTEIKQGRLVRYKHREKCSSNQRKQEQSSNDSIIETCEEAETKEKSYMKKVRREATKQER